MSQEQKQKTEQQTAKQQQQVEAQVSAMRRYLDQVGASPKEREQFYTEVLANPGKYAGKDWDAAATSYLTRNS